MKSFNIQSYLDKIYGSFPEAAFQPVIGITANFSGTDATLKDKYYSQVVAAGGTPVLIPPIANRNVIINTLQHIDGLLLSGGGDMNPLWGGEEPSPRLHNINATRDLAELLITRLAFNRHIPILGICRGMQVMATALGGKVDQDITNKKGVIKHSQEADRNELSHSVTIEKGSTLSKLYGSEKIYVNSFHHQAVRECGNRFRPTALAPDGIVEAMESLDHRPVMGVQWHPEDLEKDGLKLFRWLVIQASNFHVAKSLHKRVLTLDTHVDTPMFFHQDINFSHRDSKILVDLHKMSEGKQDAVIMAAYLPQPKMGEAFSSKISLEAEGPLAYTDLIFDKIEEIVRENKGHLSIARTPHDAYEDKRKGRKSIFFGIENGIALEHKIQNIKHFAQRGVVYITLCHNGDNDICDSAKGCNTHNGVSSFGEKVIREMNNQGIMVDLSHASEKSFYDAMDISSTPIVCSHSSCRAICDVPRNLSDEQMKALARRGGLMHITLYPGFLRKEGEATITDAISHLEHAIDVMGVEHVGIGTDFDGDGGVRGFADSSDAINFTLHLLQRKYSEKDIERIWGGNWLRLMAQVQKSRK